MALEQKLNLRLSQRLVMTPSLQQAIKLLADVPARAPGSPDPGDGREPGPRGAGGGAGDRARTKPLRDTRTPPVGDDDAPAAEKERDSFDEIDFDSYFEDYLDSAYNPRQYQEEPEEYSLENVLTRPEGLPEHLNWQLSMSEASPPVREIAAYLIGNIDEDGYLRVSREEIREAHYENDADVDAAIALVRSFDPPGVCAFDLPDCLMIQLAVARDRERADRDDHPEALARVPEPAVRAAGEDARRRACRRSRRPSRSSRTWSPSPAASTRASGRSTWSPTSSCARSATSTSSSCPRTACPSSASRGPTASSCGAATARSAPRPPTTCATRCARPSG